MMVIKQEESGRFANMHLLLDVWMTCISAYLILYKDGNQETAVPEIAGGFG